MSGGAQSHLHIRIRDRHPKQLLLVSHGLVKAGEVEALDVPTLCFRMRLVQMRRTSGPLLLLLLRWLLSLFLPMAGSPRVTAPGALDIVTVV